MQDFNEKIKSKKLAKAFELMKAKKLDDAEKVLAEGVKEAEEARDLILKGIFCSAYGVLYKIKKDFRKAWKHYEQAEKLIPDDPALKIISARLLVDYFGQYDIVIRKMNKVIELVGTDFTFLHEAHTLLGLAYLKKGDKKKALDHLKLSMGKSFEGLQTAANLDYRLIEECYKKKFSFTECREFLNGALAFAKKNREAPHEKLIQKMIGFFADPVPS